MITDTIAVTSRSFSANQKLRDYLESHFPMANIIYNEQGEKLRGENLAYYLKEADQAIIALEEINDTLLQKVPNLKHISKYGVGLDKIDLQALKKNNVTIQYTKGVNKRSVAELTLSLMLNLCNKTFSNASLLKSGTWKILPGNLVSGKTIGILGLGNVGKEVSRLVQPIAGKILAHDIDPDLDFCKKYNIQNVSLVDLFKSSDIITIHVPLDSSTKNLVSSSILSYVCESSYIINTSRGGIVDEDALYKHLVEGKLRGAASDVFSIEPTDSPLIKLDNFIGTPHIGGSSEEAILAMGLAAIEGLIR
ncbi:phosphoglycerate dehydrogenase [Pseudobacteriovorax antillogorgiicola]|uniref:D-3-phosphoglycerate dehydrogenase n=1 Tax=Pseudobacteriovorax antillogorgiicola TaxID=1513793 RepID=A0A1Y6CT91_9BACT|nr:phosphoglycerate dehydrogenase [Pseudobacteriovorax antillogorgiicola]TCS45215.1 D-3-phosphoglycerate dehydrogenase [Pseudobacteriovorax antillogorgiicola]SMF75456.1 D-3-phosphoglycerate dehydrogenase [Pseudobacteriovorax antillogorgiicola]